MALHGMQRALLDGNDRECPLIAGGASTWPIEDEIAVALLERKRATVH